MADDKLADDLSDEDRQILAENYRQAGAVLDRFIVARGEHRAAGCTDWYCTDGAHADQLADYNYHQVQQMLAVAIDRLAEADRLVIGYRYRDAILAPSDVTVMKLG